MPGRLRGQIVAVLAGAALTVASGVWAHGGTRSTGYFSTFSSLEPHVLGVSVNVFGRDNTIRLSNYSGKTVIVFGRSNEPYLRFSSKRIEKKMRSPTTFLNSSHTVPAGAGRDARPRWRKVASGASYAWHDHRIVWTGTRPPLVIRRAPHVSHLVFRWRLPATAGGKRFVIAGFLGRLGAAPATKQRRRHELVADRGRGRWSPARARGNRSGSPPREAAGSLAQSLTASLPGS